ncbi:hypothetical protein BHWA1_02284 [Brachyspira hyodysenteriae WA1]|uniref:Uncharacterized protein n=1 Tax=Brachyspira hyodysenteriae (strain ATCC 49526 / WA1) TaxID=565034 RepID=A0A3B6VBM3_BRAHW|nr:hypothetical protein BHWA1_02284 [Brachyspira hyodysenteriae WA1]
MGVIITVKSNKENNIIIINENCKLKWEGSYNKSKNIKKPH